MKINKLYKILALSSVLIPSNYNSENILTRNKNDEYHKNDSRLELLLDYANITGDTKLIKEAYFMTTPLQRRNSIKYNHRMDSLFQVINNKIHSTINRPKVNKELLIDKILDNINNYSQVVDKQLMKANAYVESRYDPAIVNKSSGASGAVQFMKNTWKEFGEGPFYPNVFNPKLNLKAAIKYNLWTENQLEENNPNWHNYSKEEKVKQLAAAYTAGFYGLKNNKYNIKKMSERTQKHVKNIFDAWQLIQKEDQLKNLLQKYIVHKESQR